MRVEPGPVPEQAQSVRIPMRDGTRLATDVYLPSGTGPWPAVLVRLPYDKNGGYCFMPEIAAYVTGRGYAAVVQDVRGKFRSEGATEFGIHEVSDGYDTVDWVCRQPWCDGDVVMTGDSYFGLTQLAAAASGHPALRAISPRLTGTRLACVVDEAPDATTVEQTSRRGYFATHYVERDTYLWEPDWSARPLADQFEQFFGALGRRSVSYDTDLKEPDGLRGPSVDDLLDAPPLPVLFTVGWFDNCAVWSWPDIQRLLRHPRWASRLHLRLEAVDHENNRLADVPITPDMDPSRSAEARARLIPRIVDPTLEFFDHCLGRSGAAETPRVAYEVCGEGWRTAEAWPPPSSGRTELYAAPGQEERRAGFVTSAPTGDDRVLRWSARPEDLVPSISENPFALVAGARDLASDTTRSDVASVDTEPFTDGLVLAGPVDLHGTLTVEYRSTDLHARLLDMAPDGTGALVARGQVRLTDIEGSKDFHVSLLHAGYRLRPGHSLRLHLASSDYPEFMFNTGDGSDAWTATAAPASTTAVRLGGPDGLRLTLTTLPAPQA
ncbi:CocE/NonD family hydrolase [Streptomyces sp. NPDC048278]|uniref:CocE/NonD family hydrolase n=1 Tax=Streptomyces sp. NPDC048278 TaxID=3155809 RepID=UPI003446EE65